VETWGIIGIDCAVDPRKVGVAVGELVDGRVILLDAVQCRKVSVVDAVTRFVGERTRVLLALDAPLGWPQALGVTLAVHRAGMPIQSIGHRLFRRTTDEVVAREANQPPLDVGSNLIARTAAAALADLQRIRERLQAAIPLAWYVPAVDGVVAIEVYPAATLQQIGITPRAYKKPSEVENRMAMFDALQRTADLTAVRGVAQAHADAFDACLCVIAGADFLLSRSRGPTSQERTAAEHEGWIWFRADGV
jgi:predicted RNase H-like nuclease